MVGMFSFLLVASGIALVVALFLMAVRAVKKKPKKPVAIAAAACAAVLLVSFVGVGVTYNPTPEQISERERIAAEKAAAKEAEEAARRETEKAAQSESPASASAESQPPEQSASVPASAPSETQAEPETSAPAESETPAQSEPPAESEPPSQDFILNFNALTPDDFGTLDTGNLALESGELLEVRYGGDVYAGKGVIIVKAKIEPNLTNKLTIRQNYHSVCALITNHGFDSCPEIQYWAVADMADGSEGKVISFTLDADAIQGVAGRSILPTNLEEHLQDLWILPSLLD